MKTERHLLGVGYVNADGRRGEYGPGLWGDISLNGEQEGKQTIYTTIALRLPRSLDKNKKYYLWLEEEILND